MTTTTLRCDHIIALIDTCLADYASTGPILITLDRPVATPAARAAGVPARTPVTSDPRHSLLELAHARRRAQARGSDRPRAVPSGARAMPSAEHP